MKDIAPGKLNPLQVMEYYRDAVNLYEENRSYGARRTFTNVDVRTSIRPSFTRQDYSWFRPDEAIPTGAHSVMAACQMYYETVGIIRNTIDLMSDFAGQGLRVEAADESDQAIYQRWFQKADGKTLSERFLSVLYRLGSVVIWRTNAITKQGSNIPYTYTLLDPLSLRVIGGEFAQFTDVNEFKLCLPQSATSLVRKGSQRSAAEQRIYQRLHPQVKRALEEGKAYLDLDSSELRCFYYKRDSWQEWGTGIIASVLEDIILLQKTKLCDLAALDGAISNVRLWNLGSLDHQLAPAPGAANRLARMLENNVGGGTIDVIWGPDLKLTESNTNIHKFLGKEKYEATLQNIYAGLGIPPTLTGSATSSGFTNNYISLKTLVERLEYGRSQLVAFWQEELQRLQEALGLKTEAVVRFDRMSLSDEAAERALLVQLLDRNILSDQSILERFGEIPGLESVRVKRESELRESGNKPEKLGPFQPVEDTTPSESETPQKGRPMNSDDTTKRKQKAVKPRSKAAAKPQSEAA